MDDLLSVKDVAEWLNVSYATVMQLIRDKEIPAARVGKLWRIKRSDVQAYLDRNATDKDDK